MTRPRHKKKSPAPAWEAPPRTAAGLAAGAEGGRRGVPDFEGDTHVLTQSAPPTHTPGPWSAERVDRVEVWKGWQITAASPTGGGKHLVAETIKRSIDAHLIASAPNLLAIVKAAVHQLRHGLASEVKGEAGREIAWCARTLDEAIAKAEGQR